jgi:nucleoside-diphosphate-sugar epimerase
MPIIQQPNNILRLHSTTTILVVVVVVLILTINTCNAFVSTTTSRTFVRQQQQSKSSSSLLYAEYNKIFIAGGSKGVGRCIIDQLVAKGDVEIKALVRSETIASELNTLPGVTAIVGNAFVIKDVENTMDGCDAAITTLGQTPGDVTNDNDSGRIDYVGNNNVIESAGILGVTRVILVTSVGCGTSKIAVPEPVYESLKDALIAKERAENILIKYYTNTKWTIIRPGGLKSDPSSGTAIVTNNPAAIGTINREDVAKLVIDVLNSSNTEQQILTAIDPSIVSSYTTEGQTYSAFAL